MGRWINKLLSIHIQNWVTPNIPSNTDIISKLCWIKEFLYFCFEETKFQVYCYIRERSHVIYAHLSIEQMLKENLLCFQVFTLDESVLRHKNLCTSQNSNPSYPNSRTKQNLKIFKNQLRQKLSTRIWTPPLPCQTQQLNGCWWPGIPHYSDSHPNSAYKCNRFRLQEYLLILGVFFLTFFTWFTRPTKVFSAMCRHSTKITLRWAKTDRRKHLFMPHFWAAVFWNKHDGY